MHQGMEFAHSILPISFINLIENAAMPAGIGDPAVREAQEQEHDYYDRPIAFDL
jgi:hypothetical protein